MSETAQPEALERSGPVMSATAEPTAEPSVRGRRGLRITLLMLAAAILVFGAAVAGVFGYLTLSRGMLSARADLAKELAVGAAVLSGSNSGSPKAPARSRGSRNR